MDGFLECCDIGEGLVGEVMRLEVAPDDFDVVEFWGVLGQALNREPLRARSKGCAGELLKMSETQPGMLRKVADDQIAALAIEIAELEAEALRLKLEINELAGADACSID